MEENPLISMARARKIIRKSIHTFLQHYQYFTSIATLIALPFSISALISQALSPRSFTFLPALHDRLNTVFEAAGFPPSSGLFHLLTLKLSQTISSSIVTLPFTVTFLLLTKASIIHYLNRRTNKKSPPTFISLYTPLLSTHLCNSFIIFSANATCFSLFLLVFTFLDGLQLASSSKWVLLLSSIGAVFYSVVLANALVVCNLALVSSGMKMMEVGESRGGFKAVLRAFMLIKGKTTTALALAVPTNLVLGAVEALFHFRIIMDNNSKERQVLVVVIEGVLIAYLYSIVLVLDVLMNCFFYETCKEAYEEDYNSNNNVEIKLKQIEEFV